MPPDDPDWLRPLIDARMTALGLSSYAVAQRTRGAVNEDTLRKYLRGLASLRADKLAPILRALGLSLTARADAAYFAPPRRASKHAAAAD